MKLDIFINELIKWNKIHKITNYTTKESIKKQIKDSLYPLKYIKDIKSAIDIGTGAGFPGLILAINMPNTKWYLVEPIKKKYSFLNYIKTILNLNNVTIVPKRLEESNITQVELITTRAVMPTKDIIKLSKPFLKKDGIILLYKGSNVFDELRAIKAKVISNGSRNYVFIKETNV